MKKLLAAILLSIYFFFSTGFVVSLHYCMDRLASAQVGTSLGDKCDYCGMQKDGHCCRDEVRVVKVQSLHLAAENKYFPGCIFHVPTATLSFLVLPFYNFLSDDCGIVHPPPLSGQGIYLENRVLRI